MSMRRRTDSRRGAIFPEGGTPPRGALERAAAWLRDAPLDWRELAPHLRFEGGRYARRTLAIHHGWEVAICCWLPGQETPLHDHAASVGVVRLLAGRLTETRYHRQGDALAFAGERAFVPGEVVREDCDVLHRVRNQGVEPAISLHLYDPPLLRRASER